MTLTDRTSLFAQQIESMFGAIAPRYDFLNRLLSCGQDIYWRRKAVDLLEPEDDACYLDLATGTADLALEIKVRRKSRARVIGADFCHPMLQLGQVKARKESVDIALVGASGDALPFADASFSGVAIAFGIRNFAEPEKGLSEILRVLKDRGKLVVLEFSLPDHPFLKWAYQFYFVRVLPLIGRLISRHGAAYSYLPESVLRFPQRGRFVEMMEAQGFREVAFRNLTFGIVSLYWGRKHV
ncbi:MAG: bifunctional demethylmenaquinone methyltransferase/2-methoxy-6-polyprenyl-1,4-benzoquinol methylase UbiE [Candidatus Nitrohelix vancouverensis]|uniref:Demethylmenaquinone methyltransferase n=1 Tax=Candidatus Nitrohelix vancouverensis TaxID=2705534 RepID=A0A7T0C3M3_9BACT|nr:MAG: bifunctional demethylmenaquinone methyltransferase/2-methoxy-6-polyprenyl-1,4-benzoquinol methylase UbiE [Candidatus Nitrohelix vancouverensis]